MIPIRDSYSVVVNGAWNPSIFSQEWILANLADDQTDNLTMAFPLDDPTSPRKLGFDGIFLYPGRKQLLLAPEDPTLEGMNKCKDKLISILQLLVHTPVSTCGINYRFLESNNLAGLLDVLNIADDNNISDDEFVRENTNVTRSFRLQDGAKLNLTISDAGQQGVQIGFNYHYELNDVEAYREIFDGGHIEQRFEQSIQFCRDTYGLALEEEENDAA